MHPPERLRRAPQAWLEELLDLFPESGLAAANFAFLEVGEIPEPYRELLVHPHHMTVTLERRHGAGLRLQVRAVRRAGSDYARHLSLHAGESEPAVLAGIMRIRLEHCRGPVEAAILAGQTPLGRILIENQVLRQLETVAFLSMRLDGALRTRFAWQLEARLAYGRLALIFCDGHPAVELLEIVAPEGPPDQR